MRAVKVSELAAPHRNREGWAPASNNGRNKGWAKRDTVAKAEAMRQSRLENQSRGEGTRGEDGRLLPNTSRRCPACASDPDVTDLAQHDACYRVVCACPCYWDRKIRDAKMGIMYEDEEVEDEKEEKTADTGEVGSSS